MPRPLAGSTSSAVISNFDGRLRRVLDDLGVSARFEGLFISSELGCESPIAQFFDTLEFMNAEPARCIHAGDDPERDWAGAVAAGSAFSSDASGSDTGRLAVGARISTPLALIYRRSGAPEPHS